MYSIQSYVRLSVDSCVHQKIRPPPHIWKTDVIYTWSTASNRRQRRVPLVEQDLPTLPENLSSPSVFSRVRVTRCVMFCGSFLPWPLSCLSLYLRIRLSLCYFQTLLTDKCLISLAYYQWYAMIYKTNHVKKKNFNFN